MAGLTSERMRRLLDEAREAFDWVIIDTPPVVLLPDANLLASMVDGAVLVVRAGSTPHELVQRAVDAIGPRTHSRRRAQPGRAVRRSDDHYQYYGYGYGGDAKHGKAMMRFLLHRVRPRSIALVALRDGADRGRGRRRGRTCASGEQAPGRSC